jgi:hypothetical protein
MDSLKPKKALRGLFSRTEPEQPIITNIEPQTIVQSHVQKEELRAQEIIDNVEEPIVSKEIVSKEIVSKQEINNEKKDLPYTVTKIQYNFDRLRQERNQWDKNEYISFLNRIDNAQTEAFFLKGKLIGEIKERFYEGNRVGWKNFCDENLKYHELCLNSLHSL